MRSRMWRRFISSFDSPGPRVPMPPASRDSTKPCPIRRLDWYCSCASSTCSLPSADDARWAKMSRISVVRSTTFTRRISSRLRA